MVFNSTSSGWNVCHSCCSLYPVSHAVVTFDLRQALWQLGNLWNRSPITFKMENLSSMCYLFLVVATTVWCESVTYLPAVSRVAAKGKSVYIPVKRELLQEMIGAFTGATLSMPDGPVMSGQPEGTHPMLIDVAEVTFKDFVEEEANNPHSYVSTVGMEITITIPFLTVATPDGPADVHLGVAVLYDGHRRGIPQPDFLYTYYAVQEIVVKGDKVTVIDGNAQISIDVSMDAPCSNVPQQTVDDPHVAPQLSKKRDDVDQLYMRSANAAELLKRLSRSTESDAIALPKKSHCTAEEGVMDDTAAEIEDAAAVLTENNAIDGAIFSLGGYPYVDLCWFYKKGTPRFCRDVDEIRYAQAVYGDDVCAFWSSDNEQYCETTAGKVTVSGWFKHIIPIETTTQTLGADHFKGDYSIALLYPCV